MCKFEIISQISTRCFLFSINCNEDCQQFEINDVLRIKHFEISVNYITFVLN